METVHLHWLCVCVCEVSLSLKHGQMDQVMPFGIVLNIPKSLVLALGGVSVGLDGVQLYNS